MWEILQVYVKEEKGKDLERNSDQCSQILEDMENELKKKDHWAVFGRVMKLKITFSRD